MKTMTAFASAALALALARAAVAAGAAPGAAEPSPRHEGRGREIVQVGKTVVVAEGETVRNVVVIGASADIKGRVEQDVVAVGGGVRLDGPVGKDVVAIGGPLWLGPRAVVPGDAVSVGGSMDLEPGAVVKGSRKEIVWPWRAPRLAWLRDWITSGLLLARPLPHRAGWAWELAAAMLLVYLLIGAAFPAAVDRCSATLVERPATALGVGALGLAMAGPAALLLVISIIGIVAVPLALCAAGAAALVGKAAVYRTAGGKLGQAAGLDDPSRRLAAIALGAAVFTLLYAVPGAGLVAWGAALVAGFGAALLAFGEQFRGEALVAAPAAEPAAAPTAPSSPPAPAGAGRAAAAARAAYPRASFMLRMGAIALDVFAFLVLVGVLPLVHAGLAAWAVYQVGLWTWKGATLGGIVCGIKGVRLDGEPMDLRIALVRHLASWLSAAAGFLGFFWAAWDPEQQTWHDKIAGTIVVRVPKTEALV